MGIRNKLLSVGGFAFLIAFVSIVYATDYQDFFEDGTGCTVASGDWSVSDFTSSLGVCRATKSGDEMISRDITIAEREDAILTYDWTFSGTIGGLDNLVLTSQSRNGSSQAWQTLNSHSYQVSGGSGSGTGNITNAVGVLTNTTQIRFLFSITGRPRNPAVTIDNINVTGTTTDVSDTCTYSGSGNWEVDCADNCTQNVDVNVLGNVLNITGTGIFTVNGSDLYNFSQIKKDQIICVVREENGGNITENV